VASPRWAFWLTRTPLETQVFGGNGLIGELTLATDRALTFNLTDPDTLTFSMPLRDPRTDAVRVMSTDVVAICGDRIVQRFRVKSRRRSKSGDQVRASFTAVAYKALLGAWLIHDQPATYTGTLPKNTMDWPASMAASSRTPSAIMWTIASEGQGTSGAHYVAMTRGTFPAGEASVVLDATGGGTAADQHYMQAGMPRNQAIDQVAGLSPGYEWSIDPDSAAPLTGLRFNVWRAGERTQFTGTGVDSRSPMTLEAGSTVADWDENEDPASWANVARVTGLDVSSTTTEGVQATAWRPATQIPDQLDYADGRGLRWPAEGAVERDIAAGRTTPQAIGLTADQEAATALDYVPDYALTLAGGKWPGVGTLWLGDKTRVVIPDIVLSSVLRVVSVSVALDSGGTSTISMQFSRNLATNYAAFRRTLELRLRALERGRR
jgi:hypothetical protein